MNGSPKISKIEIQEMIRDANDPKRRLAFRLSRDLSQKGSFDEYIDFLSENMQLIDFIPTKRITSNFKL